MKKHEETLISSRLLGALLLIVMGIVISSIDIYTPTLPVIREIFVTTDHLMQMTILLSPLMSLIFEVPFGHCGDIYGRRRLFLFTLFLFIIGSVLISICVTIEQFLAARALQAMGGAGVMVVGFSIATDIFKGTQLSRFIAAFSITNPIILGIAPIIGAYLQTHYGWRAIFLLTATIGALLLGIFMFRLHETHPLEDRTIRGGFFHFWQKLGSIMRIPTLFPLFIAHAFPIGMSLAWRASSPFIFMEGFGFSAEEFAILIAITIFFALSAGICNSYILKYYGVDTSIKTGLCFLWIFVILAAAGYHQNLPNDPFIITGVMSIFAMGGIIIAPGAASRGIMAVHYHRGLVVAAFSFFRNLALITFVFWGGYFSDDTIFPVYGLLIIGSLITLICATLALKKSSKINT